MEKVLEAVHATDCKIAPQLWHVGMARPFKGEDLPHPELPPIGPSGIDVNTLEQTAEPMSISKIEEVINAFAKAAADAKRLGFDGVELHGAHGYLIDQFFWKETNRRTDEYGGDLVGRTRFASRIIHAVRKAVGSRFPIIFRFSQWKTGHYDAKLAYTPEELEAFLAPLTDAGVDIFDCSTRRFGNRNLKVPASTWPAGPGNLPENPRFPSALWGLREILRMPLTEGRKRRPPVWNRWWNG